MAPSTSPSCSCVKICRSIPPPSRRDDRRRSPEPFRTRKGQSRAALRTRTSLWVPAHATPGEWGGCPRVAMPNRLNVGILSSGQRISSASDIASPPARAADSRPRTTLQPTLNHSHRTRTGRRSPQSRTIGTPMSTAALKPAPSGSPCGTGPTKLPSPRRSLGRRPICPRAYRP